MILPTFDTQHAAQHVMDKPKQQPQPILVSGAPIVEAATNPVKAIKSFIFKFFGKKLI